MVDRVVKTQRNAIIRSRTETNWRNVDNDMDSNKIAETGFLNTQNLCKWLKDERVIEIILGEGAHIEIVKRCDSILKFVAKNAQQLFFDASLVDLTWRCQLGKHEEMVRTVYKLIEEVVPSLELDVLDLYFTKVDQTKTFDEKFLLFLKEFSINAFQKQYH